MAWNGVEVTSRLRNAWKLLVGLGVLAVLAAGTAVGIGMRTDNGGTKFASVGRSLDANSQKVLSEPGVNPGGPMIKAPGGEISKGDAPSPESTSGKTGASGSGSASLPNIPTDRVIKTGSIDIQLKSGQLKNRITDLEKLVGGINGAYIQDSSVGSHESSFTVRVPANDFEKTLSQLGKLGKVKSTSANGNDVSAQFVDLNAQLNALQAHEARLLELMKTADVQTALTIQDELFTVQQQIDQTQGTQQLLENQTTFGTLTVSMFEGNSAVKNGSTKPSILAKSWDTAVAAFLTVLGGTLVVLSVLIPILLIAMALILMGRWIVLTIARKRQPVTT